MQARAISANSNYMTHEVFTRLGIDTAEGLNRYRFFQDAGLPAPTMHLEMELGHDTTIAVLQTELLEAVSSAAEQHGISLAELGDLDTLPDRIQAELRAAKTRSAMPPW